MTQLGDGSLDETLAAAAGPSATVREPAVGGGAGLPRGTTLGRYVVVSTLGAGGMGIVYLAYDPELDRKVALKLLLVAEQGSAGGTEGRTRLLREAQALAKLSHPNVVAIHDVGTVGEQVWLAMEFVEGETLRAWAQAKSRSWRDVLEVMMPAGRGLAAAHAAGLLHRDFKPDNVMVGSDGRVRVMDFGLARTGGAPQGEGEGDVPIVAASQSEALPAGVTRTGAMLGTPAYMAPEQLRGRVATAAADQFAYCVTLWELLWGERPFVGATLVELAASVLKGKHQPPPRGHAVPGWVRRACERGLEVETGKRFESMADLLDALGRGRALARTRKAVVVVAALALVAAGGEGYRRYDEAERIAACEAEGASIAESWNEETRTSVRNGLLATGISYAETTAQRVIPRFDEQAEAWRAATTESCLDAEVRDVWDAELLERSRSCLDDRRMELAMLADELSQADATALQKAVTAAAGLSRVDACRDRNVVGMRPLAPAESREEIREVRGQLARAGALSASGRFSPALDQAREALTRAEAIGWTPLTAAARVQTGVILEKSGDYDAAADAVVEGYFEAAQVSATEVAAQAATQAVSSIGIRKARHAEGLLWGRLAEVEFGRLRADVDDLRRVGLTNNLALVHSDMGESSEAKALLERALAIRENTLGPDHPDVAVSLNSLGTVCWGAGAYVEAKVLFERALAIFEKELGPDHPNMAAGLNNLAGVSFAMGRHEEAKALLVRALAIRETTLSPDHPDVAQALANLATAHYAMGAYAEAKTLHERALVIREKVLGLHHTDVADSLSNLANVHRATGGYEESTELNRRALAIFEKAGGPDHPDLAAPLTGIAEAALAQRQPVAAVEPAERAVHIQEAGAAPADRLAESRFVLARALWEIGHDRARARELARQAAEAYAAAGDGKSRELSEVEEWLAKHVASGP